MAVPVNITVRVTLDGVVFQDPSGVLVRVLDAVTSEIVAGGVSDATGLVALLLPGLPDPGAAYEVRFFKRGVFFSNPVTLVVLDPLPAGMKNDFEVHGVPTSPLPLAVDPALCRCTGRFIDLSGRGRSNMLVRFAPDLDDALQSPKVVGGQMVATDAMDRWTDNEGRLSVDFVRGAHVHVAFSGEMDQTWRFHVPDAPAANLIELIHPRPIQVLWSVTSTPVLLKIGESLIIETNIRFSDTYPREVGLQQWLEVESSTDAVAAGLMDNGHLSLTGVKVGTSAILLKLRKELLPIQVRNPPLDILPLLVEVRSA